MNADFAQRPAAKMPGKHHLLTPNPEVTRFAGEARTAGGEIGE
jgi:hypothetical protein